jgi:hypothetical protein
MLQSVGPDLVLVAPPNPVDVHAMRSYIAGYFAFLSGLSLLADEVSIPARIGGALLGILIGYMHGVSVVHNPLRETRFVFRPDRTVVASTAAGKTLRSGPVQQSRITLRRKDGVEPGQFEWTSALSTVLVSLPRGDFERLQSLGVPTTHEAPKQVRTRFTRSQRREFWIWSALWSVPWWGVLYRGISLLLSTT